ncbi:MAG: sigma-70 family RNA polymerase sigma factor [Thermoanaerobaculia bacterium]
MAIDSGSPTPIRSSDDLALVKRVVDRRQEALAELYDRYSPLLLAVARRIVGNPSDAEEVLQETFFQAWNQAERYDSGRSSVSTWLVLIARSRALDRLRQRQSRERTAIAAEAEPKAPDASARFDETVLTQERRKRVQKSMADLPSEQREVLSLAFFEGLSQTEIAERTGTPLGTVKTRALLAMKKLRRDLRAEIRELM